jgi:hypothetical protein
MLPHLELKHAQEVEDMLNVEGLMGIVGTVRVLLNHKLLEISSGLAKNELSLVRTCIKGFGLVK